MAEESIHEHHVHHEEGSSLGFIMGLFLLIELHCFFLFTIYYRFLEMQELKLISQEK